MCDRKFLGLFQYLTPRGGLNLRHQVVINHVEVPRTQEETRSVNIMTFAATVQAYDLSSV